MDKLMESNAKPPMPNKLKVEPLEKIGDENIK